MSSVFDVTSVVIDDGFATPVTVAITSPSVTDDVDGVEVVQIEVPGMQGAPGAQNLYPQLANPAVQYGWGPEEAGYIWIEVNV